MTLKKLKNNERAIKAKEAVEKAWKNFRLSTGLPYEPMSDKAYEEFEKAFMSLGEKSETKTINRIDILEEVYQKWHDLNNDLEFIQWLYKERCIPV